MTNCWPTKILSGSVSVGLASRIACCVTWNLSAIVDSRSPDWTTYVNDVAAGDPPGEALAGVPSGMISTSPMWITYGSFRLLRAAMSGHGTLNCRPMLKSVSPLLTVYSVSPAAFVGWVVGGELGPIVGDVVG